MASTEGPARAHDRHGRRRPFASWMKRLANLKTLHSDTNTTSQNASGPSSSPSKSRKTATVKNNPYSLSSSTGTQNGHLAFSEPSDPLRSRHSSLAQSKRSISPLRDGQNVQRSRPPTLATTAETAISDVAPSGAGTSATAPRTEGDRNSTFSSPAPSVRSMTTLTTIQSTAPPLNTAQSASNVPQTTYPNQPATAVPAHLAPHHHPTTYQSATANNVLTDDASILTLASSSKRRRRNSVDTNASMKAIPPASMFGGSRESLPLSVLSGTIVHGQPDNASLRDVSNPYPASSSKLNPERASLISASGVTAPALASERNSYIGSKYGDAASVRSGLLGGGGGGGSGLHGRNDSISGSIGGLKDAKEKEREREKD